MLKIFNKNTDYSKKLENYLSDSVEFDILAGETIDIGYYKPISDLYFEIKEKIKHEGTISVRYWDGSAWANAIVDDETDHLNRSGFLRWKKIESKPVSLNGETLHWYRISLDDDVDNLEIFGINLVFSNDVDLIESYPDIFEFKPENKQSFIAYHQEARNHILTYLRNKGKTIKAKEKFKMLDQFDLHNFDEVRQASKYLALANIFSNESDSVDDKWYQKSKDFMHKYAEAININFLSIDENDDGIMQNSESNSIQYIKVMRL